MGRFCWALCSPEHVLGVELPILKAGVEAKEILRCGGTIEGVTQLMPLAVFEKILDMAACARLSPSEFLCVINSVTACVGSYKRLQDSMQLLDTSPYAFSRVSVYEHPFEISSSAFILA